MYRCKEPRDWHIGKENTLTLDEIREFGRQNIRDIYTPTEEPRSMSLSLSPPKWDSKLAQKLQRKPTREEWRAWMRARIQQKREMGY